MRVRGAWAWKLPVIVVAIAVPVLSLEGSLDPFPAAPNDRAVYLAAGTAVAAILWCAALGVLRHRAGARRAAVARAGS